MDDAEFDRALIAAAFALAGREGWGEVSVAAAARDAGLALERARARFSGRDAILLRFGRHADEMAVAGALTEGSPRDRLFDVLMRRIDALQAHRAGVVALLRALPGNPPLALLLAVATQRSMAWMLEACGLSAGGLRGLLRSKGLTAVWLYVVRAWEGDESTDLSPTMAALDRALARAERVGAWLEGAGEASAPKPFPEDPLSAPPAMDDVAA
ncbi:MAG: TetR family transcriptional regulator [Rhodospirillales bacterium]